MSRRFTQSEVELIYSNRGAEFLDKYINVDTKYKYRCPYCKNIAYMTFYKFNLKQRCSNCKKNKKYTQTEVEKIFRDKECEMIGEYVNFNTPIEFKCKCGEIDRMSLDKFRNGLGVCKKCRAEFFRDKYSFNYEDVKEYVESQGWKMDQDFYVNNSTPIRMICPEGHLTLKIFNSFKKGHGCSTCFFIKNRGENHWKWIEDRDFKKLKDDVRRICYSMIHRILDKIGQEKIDNTETLLGYSQQDLLDHLKKEPLYEQWYYDRYNNHVDHIMPMEGFFEHGIYNPKLINALDNLRILTKDDNLDKYDFYNEEDFIKYVDNHINLLNESEQEQYKLNYK